MRETVLSSKFTRRVGRLVAGLILAGAAAAFADRPSGPCCAECGGGASTVCCSGCSGCFAQDESGCTGLCGDNSVYLYC
jgi:hypothetical protein